MSRVSKKPQGGCTLGPGTSGKGVCDNFQEEVLWDSGLDREVGQAGGQDGHFGSRQPQDNIAGRAQDPRFAVWWLFRVMDTSPLILVHGEEVKSEAASQIFSAEKPVSPLVEKFQ
ncbi:hypothetical protein P7K49_027494 [Saguinus oedipus]|uniref:Uncharacterized protein n=1 Tax=Saguinus oedipus TaxID=9490 RepID=A0ABQ9UA13_SAGOE|nr:hypothetical protein P7K49_027494 [Saguinus oedipus]